MPCLLIPAKNTLFSSQKPRIFSATSFDKSEYVGSKYYFARGQHGRVCYKNWQLNLVILHISYHRKSEQTRGCILERRSCETGVAVPKEGTSILFKIFNSFMLILHLSFSRMRKWRCWRHRKSLPSKLLLKIRNTSHQWSLLRPLSLISRMNLCFSYSLLHRRFAFLFFFFFLTKNLYKVLRLSFCF